MALTLSPFTLLQGVAIAFALFALSRSVLRFRDGQTTLKEFILWASIWIIVIIISLFPDVTYFFAKAFGINRGVDLVIYVSITALFYLMFRLYIKLDRVEKSITLLTRHDAIKNVKKKK